MTIFRTFLLALVVAAAALPNAALAAGTINVSPVAAREYAQETGSIALFSLVFDVTATGEDAYIAASSTGHRYSIVGPKVNGFVSGLMGTADKVRGDYVIRRGETERFTLIIAAEAGETGRFAAKLTALEYAGEAGGETMRHTIPASDNGFRTEDVYRAVGAVPAVTGSITVNPGLSFSGTAKGTDSVGLTITNASARVYAANGLVVRSSKWNHTADIDLEKGAYTVSLSDSQSGKVIATESVTVSR